MTQTFCSQCGKELAPTAKFCSECGHPVAGEGADSSPQGSTEETQSRLSPGLRDGLIVVGLIVVVSLVFLVIREPAQVPQPPEQFDSLAEGHEDGISTPFLDNLPQDYDGLVSTANNFMDEGNFPVAAEIYHRALDIDSHSPDVRTDYGACLHAMGLPHRAIEEFSKVLAAHPRHSIANFNMGIVYYGMKQTDSARVYFEKYLTLDTLAPTAETARRILQELEG